MKTRRTIAVCTAGVLAVIMLVSASFAWFTSKDSVKNHLETARITDGSASIVEVFTPPTEWIPGQSVTKQVSVANNGTGDVLVRVSFEELLRRLKLPAEASGAPLDVSSDDIPQLFNAAPYLENPWAAADSTLTVTGLPSGVTVKTQAVTEGGKTSYAFVALYKIPSGTYADQYQRVTADYAVDGTELTVSNVKYWAFSGMTEEKAAWADFENPRTSAIPTTPRREAAAIGSALTGEAIRLSYIDTDSVKAAEPAAGKWWYNPADGFFYYIGKLASGAITNPLLDKLTLDGSADDSYSGMEFDLFVNMEAIQNTREAITALNGWNLTGQTALIDALSPFCA
jgi:hypothetical protein